jgi:nitrite reductase (NADH) large subunit
MSNLELECARGLLDQGMEVTVLHLAEWLMEMQLDRKAGNMLSISQFNTFNIIFS